MIADHVAQQLADALRAALPILDELEGHMPMKCPAQEDLYKESLALGETISEALAAFEKAKAEPVRVKLPTFTMYDDHYGGCILLDETIAALKAQGVECDP